MDPVRKEMRDAVCRVNKALSAEGLSPLTWGNASAVDRETGRVVIKPSGIPYVDLRPELLAVVDLESGEQIGRGPKPSSDTETHRMLYRAFPDAGGLVHTHSPAATAWAQAERAIPCLGTTHADHFRGAVPVCRKLSPEEMQEHYTRWTGQAIVEAFTDSETSPTEVPAVLVPGHGAFIWGRTPDQALENAIALEHVARMALDTLLLRPDCPPLSTALHELHFQRKHGPQATYGQD